MKKMLSLLKNRADLEIIASWIKEGSTVLDLGCGDGNLLYYLTHSKNIKGMGIEIDLERMINCIEKGIPVVEHDLNQKFDNIRDMAYDYVILSQTIQELQYPDLLIEEILRIGKYGIVSFPNFGHFKIRVNLFLNGRMPKSSVLPYDWYNTPNIHLMTLKDFKVFCKERNIKILKTHYITGNRYRKNLLFPNLFAEGCVILISK